MSDTKIKACPRCGSGKHQRERRPDGNTKCTECDYKTSSFIWDLGVVVDEDQFDEKNEIISQLKEENARLKKIIAKELSENDEYGSEFVYVMILKDKLKLQSEVIEEMKEAMSMGAFHHPACPWNRSEECCCAHRKIKSALESVSKKLEKK